MVRNMLSKVRANHSQHVRKLTHEELVVFANTALEASDLSASPSRRVQWNDIIANEMVHIMSSIMEDVLQKSEPHDAELRGI